MCKFSIVLVIKKYAKLLKHNMERMSKNIVCIGYLKTVGNAVSILYSFKAERRTLGIKPV